MADTPVADFSALDKPEVSKNIFFPRPEWKTLESSRSTDISIPVEDDISVSARFHFTDKSGPTILFFHGNGEIVTDYDAIGAFYNRMGINLLPVDYRGYGSSGGTPTVTAMMQDCHPIYSFIRQWLTDNGYKGPFILMGRSLGSASALELASHYPTEVDGLIIESGFAYAEPLLRVLGIDLRKHNFRESEGFRNLDKIKKFRKPLLIIHAEFDHIIPYSDAQALNGASSSSDRTLLKIPGANHNDIFSRGLMEYMAAVKSFAGRVLAARSK